MVAEARQGDRGGEYGGTNVRGRVADEKGRQELPRILKQAVGYLGPPVSSITQPAQHHAVRGEERGLRCDEERAQKDEDGQESDPEAIVWALHRGSTYPSREKRAFAEITTIVHRHYTTRGLASNARPPGAHDARTQCREEHERENNGKNARASGRERTKVGEEHERSDGRSDDRGAQHRCR